MAQQRLVVTSLHAGIGQKVHSRQKKCGRCEPHRWVVMVLRLLVSWLGLGLAQGLSADSGVSAVFTTNYIYRGYSKSNDQPVAQVNLEHSRDNGLYGGLWTSMVNFGDSAYPDAARAEINPYLGWVTELSGGWRGEMAVQGYVYAGKIEGETSNYAEFQLATHYQDWFSARWAYAPSAYGREASTFAYELLGRYSLMDTLQASVTVGLNQAVELLDQNYPYWSAGITWYPWRFLALDARYVDSGLREGAPGSHNDYFVARPLDNTYLITVTVGGDFLLNLITR
jgi:uncharacterized protein (TIGR02001 family)